MTIKTHHRLLLTGAGGGLGTALRDRLKTNCDVLRLSGRSPIAPLRACEEMVIAELDNAGQVAAAVEGCEAIVHMGGVATEQAWAPILQGNIVGVYNLYEAARLHGVKRVIFASSNHVTGFYRQSETITPDHPARPDGLYGVSKAFGEQLSRMYFDRYGIETACLRIGSSFAKPTDRRMLASWLSFDDLHRLITACLATPVLGHTIIFGASDNAASWWDNGSVRHIGYRPLDTSDIYREEVHAATPEPDPRDPAVQFQGGAMLMVGEPMTAHLSRQKVN